ncbi:MAG: hypothetical protein Q9195_009167, partial [Heterodermia aff. obscurata]
MEDADLWSPYLDSGMGQANTQPSRTRAVALQISALCEISSDLLLYFYHPTQLGKPLGKQAELKKLSELHTRLEAWRKNLPKEMDPKEGQLPAVLIMHMFFQLLFIHLFRPFLRYKPPATPLPAHVSPRKFCTQAASMISKLLRLYKRTHGLRQIVNISVYILHSACTIHLLNLPEKNAERDIIHGVKHLEEIAESWLCARKTLEILHGVSRRWNIDLPKEAEKVFARAEAKFGHLKPDQLSPKSESLDSKPKSLAPQQSQAQLQQKPQYPTPTKHPSFPLSMNGFDPQVLPPITTTSVVPDLTPQPTTDLNSNILKPPGRRPSYVLAPSQQDLWNQDRALRGAAAPQANPQ